jgi:protein required for attachment to host cells
LKTRETFAQDNPPSHVQGGDRPGKIFSGKDGRHAATEEADFHEQAAIGFLGKFATHLNREMEAHAIESLVLVAPARALGILRSQLSPQARRSVIAEWDKDYVKLPVHKMTARLVALGNSRET